MISRGALFFAAEQHAEARQFLSSFYRIAKRARWRGLRDVRNLYPSADLVGRTLVINVGGNRFRLLFCANFQYQALFFKGLYTHAQYDRIRVEELCPR